MLETSELQHLFTLAFCCLVGLGYRLVGTKRHMKITLFFVGCVLIFSCCGYESMWYISMVAGGCFLIKSSFVKSPRVIFVFCAILRISFRSAPYLGFPLRNDITNELLMLGVIRMITVTYEIFEFRSGKKDSESGEKCTFGALMLESEPSAFDIVCYMTLPIGIFTGPICKFRTYSDLLKHPYKPASNFIQERFWQFVLSLVVFGVLMINGGYFKSAKYLTDPLQYRLGYVYLVGWYHQMTYVQAWLFAELACTLIGLGMYPVECKSHPTQGPTVAFEQSAVANQNETKRYNYDDKDAESSDFDFNSVKIVYISKLVRSSTFGRTIPSWNCGVQWWLVHFIYRCNIIPRNLKLLRGISVFAVSAIWHGVNPGYFMVILPFPLVIALEETCIAVERDNINGYWAKKIYLFFHWTFVKMFCHLYFITAFKLLDYQLVWNFYKLTYFAGFVFPIVMFLICKLIRRINPVHLQKDKQQ